MKAGSEAFLNIIAALNDLYKKADEILLQLEIISGEIREGLKVDAGSLAEEAFRDDRDDYTNGKKSCGTEPSPPIGETGFQEPELDIW